MPDDRGGRFLDDVGRCGGDDVGRRCRAHGGRGTARHELARPPTPQRWQVRRRRTGGERPRRAQRCRASLVRAHVARCASRGAGRRRPGSGRSVGIDRVGAEFGVMRPGLRRWSCPSPRSCRRRSFRRAVPVAGCVAAHDRSWLQFDPDDLPGDLAEKERLAAGALVTTPVGSGV